MLSPSFRFPDACQLVREDGLIYVFLHQANCWTRSDRDDIQLCCDNEGFWYCTDSTGEKLGIPSKYEKADRNRPPEGMWQSRKGDKSYTYNLFFLQASLLRAEYEAQESLRQWDAMLQHLEQVVGSFHRTIYDLGCGAGAMTAKLSNRNLNVISVDIDPQMVACTKQRCPSADVRRAHLDKLDTYPSRWTSPSGIWSSFTAAYFPSERLISTLASWTALLEVGGWMCLSEIDGLFSSHGPMEAKWKEGFQEVDMQLLSLGYDSRAGLKLKDACLACGLEILDYKQWSDDELYFQGAAGPAQLAAWSARVNRPSIRRIITEVFGELAESAVAAFLECLSAHEHVAAGSVHMIICSKTS